MVKCNSIHRKNIQHIRDVIVVAIVRRIKTYKNMSKKIFSFPNLKKYVQNLANGLVG